MNTEQLRKDMEAGTHKRTALTYNDVEWCAKRIAELERIALAAEGLADAVNITAKQELDPIGAWSGSPLSRALAAYREATK